MHTLNRNALTVLILGHLAIVPGHAIAQDAVPAAGSSDKVTELDSVVVTGRRAAERAAVDDKRYADGQVDAIRSDDVGRLPDQNVAEAARRLPGVTTVNDQGEGRYLTVRGVAADLLNVTLNGQTSTAPEPESRQVKLDDIPSSLIGAVTVSKTLTPDLDANAIAGQVNIETLSAFDRNRTFGTARAAYGYSDINAEHPYEYDGSFGTLFGTDKQFGMVLALNHSDRVLGTQNIQNTGDWIDVDGRIVPEGLDIRQYDTHRERSGAVANFEWRPNDDTKAFLRFLYSKYQDEESRDRLVIEFDEDGIAPDTDRGGTFSDASAQRALRTRQEDTSTFTVSTGSEFKFDERKLTVEATYSKAKKRDPHRDEWSFVQDGISGSYALGRDTYTVTPDGEDAYDASLFEPDFYEPESREAIEDLYQARADYLMPLQVGDGSDLQFGVKYLDRRKSNDLSGRAFEYAGGPLTLADVSTRSIGSVFGGRYRLGPVINNGLANAYFLANPDEFEEDEDATLSASLAGDFLINETITSAYAMTRLRFGDVQLIPGVRVERTQGDYQANSFELGAASLDQGFNVSGKRTYTDWFPGINVRYDVGANLVFRAAATRAIGRPNYEALAPYVEVEDAQSDTPSVSAGNPNLKPLYSNNLDLSAEYYVGNRGLLAAAVFYKKIKNPIYTTTLTGQDGTFGGIDLVNAEVGTFANAQEATLKGVEFNAQYELSFLPSPFDGFNVGANISFSDSEASGLPTRDDTVPLLNQSDRVASAQLSYEKYGFSARVAYTYRSGSLLEANEEDRDGDIYVDDFHQWDVKFGYAFNPNFSVFLEGSNLNDAAYRTYIGYRDRLGEKELSGWSARAGVQLTF